MILNSKPLTLTEAKSYFRAGEEKKPLEDYFKAFIKLSKEKSDKLSEEIRALNNLKLKEDIIVKIVDLIPKDAEDLNKIVLDVSLNEGEINAILEITKKY
jgi:DNA-directed RNA polymerase subunit F